MNKTEQKSLLLDKIKLSLAYLNENTNCLSALDAHSFEKLAEELKISLLNVAFLLPTATDSETLKHLVLGRVQRVLRPFNCPSEYIDSLVKSLTQALFVYITNMREV